jgi:hypothetical protein
VHKRRSRKHADAETFTLNPSIRFVVLVRFCRLNGRAWEAEIEAFSIWQNMMTYFEQFERHLLDEILVFANLIQIPAVILTGGVAWEAIQIAYPKRDLYMRSDSRT